MKSVKLAVRSVPENLMRRLAQRVCWILLMMPLTACSQDSPPLLPPRLAVQPTQPVIPAPRTVHPTGEPGTAIVHERGWIRPIKLPFNDDGWEDSPYITRDGSRILFFYHPYPDLITTAEALTEYVVANPQDAESRGLDGKLYVSVRPFATRHVHPISLDGSPALECCPYLSRAGDLFYVSNRRSWELMDDVPVTVYRNGKRLDFGTGQEESNPHYCEALDELWFDCPGDANLCVMRQAAARDFRGPVELAPYPVNARDREAVQDSQAFLTDDCRTLYVTSDRESRGVLQIYRLERLDDEGRQWSEPDVFISNSTSVAELSMTADGRELVFAQIFWRDDGTPGIDIYYSRKRDEH